MREIGIVAAFVAGLFIVGEIADTEDWLHDDVRAILLMYIAASVLVCGLVDVVKRVRRRR